jgi:2,3,4,5-tetrahydropyridine-2-carboxylate N-succinyltransferase
VLIGGNTRIYEGAIIKARAVIAAGTKPTGSTPFTTRSLGEITGLAADRPLAFEGAPSSCRARRADVGQRRRAGLPLATPVIVIPRLAHRRTG